MGLQTEPGADIDGSGVAIYFTDEHGVDTFGVELVAGEPPPPPPPQLVNMKEKSRMNAEAVVRMILPLFFPSLGGFETSLHVPRLTELAVMLTIDI